MAQAIINGRVYIIYENIPTVQDSNVSLLMEEMRRREKHTRERDWKRRAVTGYRKK